MLLHLIGHPVPGKSSRQNRSLLRDSRVLLIMDSVAPQGTFRVETLSNNMSEVNLINTDKDLELVSRRSAVDEEAF